MTQFYIAYRSVSLTVQGKATARFDETIEIAINLGTNPKRGDQAVRGTAVLPYGTGKSIRVAAFAEGEDAAAASAAGKANFRLHYIWSVDSKAIASRHSTLPIYITHLSCPSILLWI